MFLVQTSLLLLSASCLFAKAGCYFLRLSHLPASLEQREGALMIFFEHHRAHKQGACFHIPANSYDAKIFEGANGFVYSFHPLPALPLLQFVQPKADSQLQGLL